VSATELANSDVSVYTLVRLLGHESTTTSQRYVAAAGTETRNAVARNPLYALIPPSADIRDQELRAGHLGHNSNTVNHRIKK
jgi:hypothetical protein